MELCSTGTRLIPVKQPGVRENRASLSISRAGLAVENVGTRAILCIGKCDAELFAQKTKTFRFGISKFSLVMRI